MYRAQKGQKVLKVLRENQVQKDPKVLKEIQVLLVA
jgi:hypothetical protein